MTSQSSGETALATVSDTAVDAITAGGRFNRVRIVNEGSVSGFYSTDGGTTWQRLPAASILTDDELGFPVAPAGITLGVKIKRVAGGPNLSGVYVSAW